MATVPTPRTWTVGELLTAAKLNTDLRDGLTFLLSPPLAVLKASAGTVTGGGDKPIAFQLEDIDRDGGHSTVTNVTRYTAQTAGWYSITSTVGMTLPGGSDGYSDCFHRKNGTTKHASTNLWASTNNRTIIVAGKMFLAVGDYAEVALYLNATITTDAATARFELEWCST